MVRLTAALAALLLAAAVHAQPAEATGGKPVLKLPAQVQAQPGQPFIVAVESNLKWMRWTVPSGLTRVPVEWTKDREAAFVGYGPAGVYEFKIEGTVGDVFAEGKCVVFIGTPPVPPGPTPPGPGPVPPGPSPGDPLAADLAKAYAADGSPAELKAKLSQVYRFAAEAAKTDATLTTVGQLNEKVSLVGRAFVGADVLPHIRQRVKEENAKALPAGIATPLGDVAGPGKSASETRQAISLHYTRLASILDSLK